MASAARPEPGSSALILALVSGILLALSFPRYGHPLFAWIALAPLIVVAVRRSQAQAPEPSKGEFRGRPQFAATARFCSASSPAPAISAERSTGPARS